jgi:hypothetical protein
MCVFVLHFYDASLDGNLIVFLFCLFVCVVVCVQKERSPAYTDRVLWRSFPGHTATPLAMGSAPTIITSDHKPVWSSFRLTPFRFVNGSDANRGPCTLTITQLKARGLPPADIKSKSADPYIKV